MAKENRLTVALIGKDKSLSKTFTQAWAKADTFGKKMDLLGKKMTAVGGNMTRNFTLPIVGGMALATKAAVDEEKEMALLSQALKKNTGATDAQVAATERWITKTQNWTGIADGELRPALANLVRATKDTGEAQDLMATAMDISAATGKNLGTVTMAMNKAYNGNVGALGRLGIKTKDATGATMTFDQVMANAAKTFGGSAAAAADTTAGKFAIMKAKMMDVSEQIGTILIPVAEELASWLSEISGKFSGLSDGQKKFAIAVLAIIAAVGPLLVVLGKLIRTIYVLQVALSFLAANPVVLAVAAVAAIATGLFIAYQKSEKFRAAVNWLGNAISSVFPTIAAVVGVAVDLIRLRMEPTIAIVKALGKIGTLSFAPLLVALNAIRTAIEWIIDKVKSAVSWLGKLKGPKIDLTPGFDIPGVPFGARGGIVTRPTLAVIGEAGPEAVVPLNRTRGSSPLGGGLGTGLTVNFHGDIVGVDADDLASQVAAKLGLAQRRLARGMA